MPVHVKNIDVVTSKMKAENLPFYVVKDTSNGTILDRNNETSEIDVAIDNLKGLIDNLEGLVTITISSKTTRQKAEGNSKLDTYTYNLKLGNNTSIGSTNMSGGGNNMFMMLMEQMNANHALQLKHLEEKYETNKRIEALLNADDKEDNKQIFLNKAWNRFEKYLDREEQKIQAPVQKIAGVPEQQQQPRKLEKIQMSEEQQKQLNLAIHILLENDKNFIENITALAKLSKDDPEIYQVAVNKLKKLA